MVAWYTIDFEQHFPSRGHSPFALQLQDGVLWVSFPFRVFILCDFIKLPTLGIHEYESFTVFLLSNL